MAEVRTTQFRILKTPLLILPCFLPVPYIQAPHTDVRPNGPLRTQESQVMLPVTTDSKLEIMNSFMYVQANKIEISIKETPRGFPNF